MPDLSSEFYAPSCERSLTNVERRDKLEMMNVLARHLDRVYANYYFEEERPTLPRAEFVKDALSHFAKAGEATKQPLEAFILDLLSGGGEILAELDPDHEFYWLSQLEKSARRIGEQQVAVLARAAITQLTESVLEMIGPKPDVPLTVLLRLRELIRRLDEILVALIYRRRWLTQLSEALAESFDGEGAAERTEPHSLLERGPPPPTWISAVQPHAPPGRFFSAPRGESVEMRLGTATEGLMAA